MKEFWTYTGLRIGLFLASAAVVWGVYAIVADSINLLVVLLIAAVISSVLSWKLLAGPRARLAGNIDSRASRAVARFEEVRAKEDAEPETGTEPEAGPGKPAEPRPTGRSADRQADQ